LISGQTTYPHMTNSPTMAGVLWLLKGSQRELKGHHKQSDPRALELQAAKEILAEVFGVRASEVDEMLKLRHEEKMDWPREFYLAD
jgi:hypothetical protein